MATTEVVTRLSVKNILFPTDFSGTSRTALAYAAAIARHFESAVHLVHVVTPVASVLPFEPFPLDCRTPAEEQLATFLKSDILRDVAHDGLLKEGNLSNVLQGLFEEHVFDLIVMGTHGRGGLQKLALGSTAEEIIRSAPCPVLAVGPLVSDSVAAEFSPRKILCATDLLPDSSKALAYSVALAEESGARLTLVHAVHAFGEDVACPNALQWNVKRQLEKVMPKEASLISNPESMIEFGATAEVILRASARAQADLIVMGVKHTDHPWLTSHATWVTIHQVLVQSHCPVLTVRV